MYSSLFLWSLRVHLYCIMDEDLWKPVTNLKPTHHSTLQCRFTVSDQSCPAGQPAQLSPVYCSCVSGIKHSESQFGYPKYRQAISYAVQKDWYQSLCKPCRWPVSISNVLGATKQSSGKHAYSAGESRGSKTNPSCGRRCLSHRRKS